MRLPSCILKKKALFFFGFRIPPLLLQILICTLFLELRASLEKMTSCGIEGPILF